MIHLFGGYMRFFRSGLLDLQHKLKVIRSDSLGSATEVEG
jgi:hypothetical protein